MPELDRISGIRICVFSRDHLPPHFHAYYGEYEALIDIRESVVIAGQIPRKKLMEALAYLSENRVELLETFYQLNPSLRK